MTNSAMGLRQMLPWQMNRIFVIDLNLLKIMDVKWNILISPKKDRP